MSLQNIIKDLKQIANPKKVPLLSSFFKTGPGEYGEGDIFIGITVAQQRRIAKKYQYLANSEIIKLLKSPIHEYRLTALLILVLQYEQANNNNKQKQIYNFYLKNSQYINSWDLVDTTTPKIIGAYLLKNKNKRKILYQLVKSPNIWERRIAVLACWPFIKNNDFIDILKISKLLLKDKQDLIHKAVGWMLREMGKKNSKKLKYFLDIYSKTMPRTMLRYSIERLNKQEKKEYMKKDR